MKFCSHYKALKPQRIANLINNYKPKCQNSAKHTSEKQNLWQCMGCQFVGCSRSNSQECANKHAAHQGHSLTISVSTGQVFCYKCDQSLQEQIDLAYGLEIESADLDNLMEFTTKCQKYCQNLKKKAEQNDYKMVIQNSHEATTVKPTKTKNPQFQKLMEVEQTNAKSMVSSNNFATKLNVFGLNNLGNTCFYNSILQCLYATAELHNTYPHIDFTKACQDNTAANLVKTVYHKLQIDDKFVYNPPKVTPSLNVNRRFQLFLNSGNTVKNCLNPSDLFAAVGNIKTRFRSMAQQDAQQLLRCLLDALNQGEITYLNIDREYLKAIQMNGRRMKLTTIEEIFGCFLASRLHCLNCQKVSWTMDLCLDLNIQLSGSKVPYIQVPHGTAIPQQEIHAQGLSYPPKEAKVPSMLEHFFSAQPLSKLNYFNCEKCKASKATKKLYIKDPPQNLTIVLKRFTNAGQKNNADVPFPLVLDISGACINPGKWIYNLYGVSVHQGGARGGHYIAYTRRNNSWYFFSDSHWKQVTENHVKSAQAYILFYQKA